VISYSALLVICKTSILPCTSRFILVCHAVSAGTPYALHPF
jgi:hypothetical protein